VNAAGSLLQAPLVELKRRLDQGEITAVDLIEATLDRIETSAETINAFAEVDAAGARRAAIASDSARRSGDNAPMSGIPISVKDAFDVAGMRATSGRLSDARRSARDAPVVRRLREAGAIIVGKTTVPDFLSDRQVVGAEFGITRNPWDPGRTPGGSSTGAAAAVAAGLSTLDLGSDLAGSLRMPAAWCGLYGHKPSNGIVSKASHMPWPEGGILEPMISAVGPMTRSAIDLGLVFDRMVGPEGPRSRGWKLDLPPARATEIRGARIGLWLDDPTAPIDMETRTAILAVAAALEAAGGEVTPIAELPGMGEEGEDLFLRLQAGEVAHGFDEPKWREHVAAAAEGSRFSAYVTQTFREGMDALERQMGIVAAWQDDVFSRFDVILTPATACVAPPLVLDGSADRSLVLDGRTFDGSVAGAWSRLTLLPQCATTVVPAGPGSITGLPVGLQIVGAHLDDRTTLAFATEMERQDIVRYSAAPEWR
jgi:amidase